MDGVEESGAAYALRSASVAARLYSMRRTCLTCCCCRRSTDALCALLSPPPPPLLSFARVCASQEWYRVCIHAAIANDETEFMELGVNEEQHPES